MTIQIIIIKKNTDLQEKNVKTINQNEIYKLLNYKNDNDFYKLHTFNDKYEIYGKRDGKANTENKYEFPPPIDKELYFGNLCILKKEEDNYVDLSIDEWNKIYEKLFGGFEDLDVEEVRSVDSEEYETDELTEQGYLKDNFVVDDDELQEEEYVSYDEDEDEFI